ncbi:hypothetical protein ACV35P_34935 [Pseudomonas aeruginosa]
MTPLLPDDAAFWSADRAVLNERRIKPLPEVPRAENGATLRYGRLGVWMAA